MKLRDRLHLPGPRPELTCRELVELVTDYLEGALAPGERRRFEHHVTTCPGCTAHLDQLHALHAQFGRLRPGDLDPQTEQDLRRAFGARRAR